MSRLPRITGRAVTSEREPELATEKLSQPKVYKSRFSGLNAGTIVRVLLWVGLGLALGPRLLDFFGHSFEVLAWRWQIDYDEGLNLSAAWHLSQSHNIYANSIPERFIAAPYPPFYFGLNAMVLKLFGVSLLGGRLLTFGSSLLIAGLISFNVWLAARRHKLGQLDASGAGLFAGLIWFCLPPTYIWSTLYKQDMFAIAVALLGLSLVYLWQDSKRLYWAAPVLALAFFTKQNELSLAGVAGLYIVGRELLRPQPLGKGLQPNWKRAFFFGLALGGWLLVPFGLLNLLTRNGYYNHVIGYQLVPWKLDDLTRRAGRVFGDHWPLLALALLYLGVMLWEKLSVFSPQSSKSEAVQAEIRQAARRVARWLNFGMRPGGRNLRPETPFPLYLLVAFASLFTLGAYQGNYNLTLDFFPPLLIAVGLVLARLTSFSFARLPEFEKSSGSLSLTLGRSSRWLTLGLLLAAVGWQVFNFADPASYFSYGSMPAAERRGMLEYLATEISQTPGDFLTEDIYLPLSQGRNVPYDNLYHMRLEAQQKKWDDRLFLQDLRDRRFGLVLLEHGSRRWTDQGWQTLGENYQLVFPGGIDLWRPRPRPLVPQHQLENCSLVRANDNLSLQGYSSGPVARPLYAGDGLTLTTYWKVAGKIQSNYTLFVHLIDSQGKLVAQRDAPPDALEIDILPGEVASASPLPTSRWLPGERAITIDQSLPLPAALAPGTYSLIAGAYLSGPTGLENMQPQCSNASGTAIRLGEIKVRAKL